MLQLDHILWAAPDLEKGMRLFNALSGVAPARGGSHPGFGTRNSLAGLGDGLYLEIISPDPAQELDGDRGGEIAALPHPGLLTFALRAKGGLAALRTVAGRCGLTCDGPVAMTRKRPDGVTLAWSILYLRHQVLGYAVPFAIDWGTSPHPSASAPAGCRLKSFAALQPDPDPLLSLYRALDVPVDVKRGARPGFLAILETPRGEVVLMNP